MINLKPDDTLILLIDIQDKLLNAVYNKEDLNKKAEIIAKASKILNLQVFVTEQYPQGLGKTVESIADNLANDTMYFEKVEFSALKNENIIKELKKAGKKNILLFGIETHICVYQTALDLVNNGFCVTIIKDICGSRTEYEYESALKCLASAQCSIKTLEMVLFELLSSAKHPCFKDIQNLIK